MAAHRPLILIADDESKIRRLVSASLEMAGFDVCTAADGEEALETFERLAEKPDLIVLDLMMPGLDGLEVLEKLRQKSAVPVIMLTAKGEERDELLGFELFCLKSSKRAFTPCFAALAALLVREACWLALQRMKCATAPFDWWLQSALLSGGIAHFGFLRRNSGFWPLSCVGPVPS